MLTINFIGRKKQERKGKEINLRRTNKINICGEIFCGSNNLWEFLFAKLIQLYPLAK